MLLVEDPVFSGDKWRHTGFNVFFGPRILPWQEKSIQTIVSEFLSFSIHSKRQ
jgi:hypothetical protein